MMDNSYEEDVLRFMRKARVVGHSQMMLTVGRALRMNGYTDAADFVMNNCESLMAYARMEDEERS